MDWLNSIAGVVSFLGFIPYIASIFRKETRPNMVTWIIWTAMGGLLCASYYAAGAPLNTLMVPFAYVLGPFVVLLLAIKYGVPGYNKFDIFCLIAGAISLILWIVTGDAVLALGLFVLVDIFGALPTVRKVYLDPKSENLSAWSIFLGGNTLNLISLPIWSFAVLVYPLYLFFIALLVTLLILRGKSYPSPVSNHTA